MRIGDYQGTSCRSKRVIFVRLRSFAMTLKKFSKEIDVFLEKKMRQIDINIQQDILIHRILFEIEIKL